MIASKQTLVLVAVALAQLAVAPRAQTPSHETQSPAGKRSSPRVHGPQVLTRSGKVFTRYGKPLRALTLDVTTGTLTRAPAIANRSSSTVVDFDNMDLSGFVGVETGNGFCRWMDAAIKGTGAGRTAGVVNHSDLMNSIVFAYCSAKLTPGSGGPGGSVHLGFYEGYTFWGGAATTSVAQFTLSGLPGNSTSSSFFGGFQCYTLKVLFDQLLSYADGPIGYSWHFLDSGTATNPLGAVLAGTWPFLACTVSCSGTYFQVDAQGMLDSFDLYCPPTNLIQIFTFGTTSGSWSSIAMAIEEVVDQPATISSCPGIPAAPDVLTSTPVIVAAPWTATLTSGLPRAAPGTWTLFFGNAGIAKPTGFLVPQIVGGGNFGTSKAGRRLLCDIDASNPSGCAGIVLPAGIGSSSSCSALIPKKISLVCNAWCGQAIVLGAVPAGVAGGGNVRLSNAVSGVVGTNP